MKLIGHTRLDEPYIADTLSKELRKHCITNNLQRIAPYTLWMSFSTFCAERGMEEMVLMCLMRHSDF